MPRTQLANLSRATLGLLGIAGVALAVFGIMTGVDGFVGNLLGETSGILIGSALTAFVIERVQREESVQQNRELRV